MDIIEKALEIKSFKLSLGKNDEFFPMFSKSIEAKCMHDDGFGLGIPNNISPENQIRGALLQTIKADGIILFNISGVNIDRAISGFENYEDASSTFFITEWELSVILENNDFLENTIFHNGKVDFHKTSNGLEKLWN